MPFPNFIIQARHRGQAAPSHEVFPISFKPGFEHGIVELELP